MPQARDRRNPISALRRSLAHGRQLGYPRRFGESRHRPARHVSHNLQLAENFARVPDPAKKTTGRRGTAQTAILSQIGNNGGGQIGGGQGGGGSGNVGYQPVVAFINEGVTMSALATVSGDRRYVRITATPVFSNITDVFTFSFISSGGGGGAGR